jgi:hypothetical protein
LILEVALVDPKEFGFEPGAEKYVRLLQNAIARLSPNDEAARNALCAGAREVLLKRSIDRNVTRAEIENEVRVFEEAVKRVNGRDGRSAKHVQVARVWSRFIGPRWRHVLQAIGAAPLKFYTRACELLLMARPSSFLEARAEGRLTPSRSQVAVSE